MVSYLDVEDMVALEAAEVVGLLWSVVVVAAAEFVVAEDGLYCFSVC